MFEAGDSTLQNMDEDHLTRQLRSMAADAAQARGIEQSLSVWGLCGSLAELA